MADISDVPDSGEVGISSTDGSGWVDSAVNWSILTMHYLSCSGGVDLSSEADVSAALQSLDQHEHNHPPPDQPSAVLNLEADSENEEQSIVSEVVRIVQVTLHGLDVRRRLLLEQKPAAEGGDVDSVAVTDSCISPDIEDGGGDEAAPDAIEWLPFPTKRPSQMDLHNWVLSFQSDQKSSSKVAGQFKRQRLESPAEGEAKPEPMTVAEEPAPVEGEAKHGDETDTAPDKGAYLAMMRKRQDLADELISSERRYVEDLECVLKNYHDGYDYGSLANVPNSLRGRKNIVFGNLKKILEFNKISFEPALQTIQKTPLKIGQTFMDNERDLGLYSVYFKNAPAQEELLEENAQFFRSIQIRLNDAFTVQSYLIKPFQRMVKYRQFLESFQNYTPKTEKMEKFHEELTGALWLVKFQLRHGNDLLALDRMKGFDGNPAEQGLLLRQGEFTVQDKKGKHERRVFLFEEMLVLCKKQKPAKGAKEGTYLFKEGYKVCDMGLAESIDNYPAKFELYFKRHASRESIFLSPVATEGQTPLQIHNDWVADIQKLLWQQFKRVKERMINLRGGVESSMFGNKRASTLYGDVGMLSGSPGERNMSLISGGSKEAGGARVSTQTGGSGGYAVPTAIPQRQASIKKPLGGVHNISSPVLQAPAPAEPAPGAYAVSAAVIVGERGASSLAADPRGMPPPTVPPPPIPSTETSGSSGFMPPPVPHRQAPPSVATAVAAATSEYLLPDEPKPPVPPQPPLPVAPQRAVASPTRPPPPPPIHTDPQDQPLPAVPGDTGGEDDEPIYDDVSSDEFTDSDLEPDRQSVGTTYEEVDGKKKRRRRRKKEEA